MSTIKAGYLISYDYEYVKISLLRIYDFVDEIFLAIDVDRKTWSGKDFLIRESFWEWIKLVDNANKIKIYEDRFYIPGLSPMQCDTRERNMLAQRMGDCDWYLQIDSDEYFIDFEVFASKLRRLHPTVPTTIVCPVATIFKKVVSGYLLIAESSETLCFATNLPVYDNAKHNSGNNYISWDDLVLHQSWAREPEEIYWKLHNWSHKNDFNINSYYNLWNAVDEFNFFSLQDFHPLGSGAWPKLKMIKAKNIVELLNSEEVRMINRSEKDKIKRKPLTSRLWKEIRSSFKYS
ncbi:hypothetical protein SAMN06265348_108196 [Pedobacter westerhofensis]|uniref:Glycosyl transferase family 2 n=1 Tax=Pedobacter westerhofensis TaxID=425512 RepID=A0A521EIQ7_9SPHI|nr:hypothetical protein [Pedobacter westerhofensis]SMO83788.1 hypothetical protein SAMN06265348_108196 [Pedobacter westerhofensis]